MLGRHLQIELAQALSVAARHAPAPGTPRPEAGLEEALVRFWDRWSAATHGTVRRQARMRAAAWPGVGPVDIELSGGAAPVRMWIEVKWQDLWNCPWDVAKLAVALAEGLCDQALLVAAASVDGWSTPGGEFFSAGRWSMADDVLRAHHRSWLHWKKDVKTRPLRLPSEVRTAPQPGCEHDFALRADSDWSLRAVSLHLPKEVTWVRVGEDRLAATP